MAGTKLPDVEIRDAGAIALKAFTDGFGERQIWHRSSNTELAARSNATAQRRMTAAASRPSNGSSQTQPN